MSDEPAGTGSTDVTSTRQRPGAISYLHIPAVDVRAAAAFYGAAFGWTIHNGDTDRPGFEDGTGHLGGAWVSNQVVSAEPGLLPYIYVDNIDAITRRIEEFGGQIVAEPILRARSG